MSLKLFEGAAGTGKTTRLFGAAKEHLRETPLEDEQRVLALTKYHGSRKRMDGKLNGRDGLGVGVDCFTIDSFAWHLVRRWRGLVRHLGSIPAQADFQAIASAAGQLLRQPGVGRWVARRYPLVIVDEMQDCKGGTVELLAALEPHVRCLCAADAFQDLSGDLANPAISWAAGVGDVVTLDRIYRTDRSGLLDAAHALRNGLALESNRGAGFEIRSVPKAPMGGGITSWKVKSWTRFGEIAVISATAKETSPFCRQLVTWTSTKTAKSRRSTATAGPYPLDWERSDNDASANIIDALGLPDDKDAVVSCAALAETAWQAGVADVRDWLRRERFVLGTDEVTVNAVIEQVKEIVRRRRVHGTTRPRKRIALTIHQAKNREFESVIVLWPMRMKQGDERQRRLLYNAVTRARRQALVLVEDPRRNRLKEPLFQGRA